MINNNRTIAVNTIMLYIRMFFNMAIALYTSRVILETLGVENFGIYTLVAGVLTLLSFISTSMSSTSLRFICANHNKDNRQLFSTIFFVHLAIAIIVAILAESVGVWFINTQLNITPSKVEAALKLFHFVVTTSAISLLYSPYNALIIASEKLKIFAIIDMVYTLLKLGIVLLLPFFTADKLVVYGALQTAITLLIFIGYFIYCFKRIPLSHLKWQISKKELVAITSYTSYDLYGNLTTVGRTQGVNILLNIFFGTVANAASGIATQVQTSVLSFATNIQMAIKPQIIKSYNSGNLTHFISLINSGMKYITLLLFMISLPLILRIEYILNLWLKTVPEYTAEFTVCVLIFNIGASLVAVMAASLHGVGNIKRLSFVNGTLYLTVVPITFLAFKMGASSIFPYVANIVIIFISFILTLFNLKKLVPSYKITSTIISCFIPLLKVIPPTFLLVSLASFIAPNNFLGVVILTLLSVVLTGLLTFYFAVDYKMQSQITGEVKKGVKRCLKLIFNKN